jgi:hypothetical protein
MGDFVSIEYNLFHKFMVMKREGDCEPVCPNKQL